MKKTYSIPCTMVVDVNIANSILTGSTRLDIDPSKETNANLVIGAGFGDDLW